MGEGKKETRGEGWRKGGTAEARNKQRERRRKEGRNKERERLG